MIILPDGTVSINTTAAKVEEMANKIIDNIPVDSSNNLITSGAVYTGLQGAGKINEDGGFRAGGGDMPTGAGGAIGNEAATIGGGAVGNGAGSLSGGAIGQGATATNGFAGGQDAKSRASGSAQLCAGTNETANTLQFKNFTVINASGKVPLERLDIDNGFVRGSTKPSSCTAISDSFKKNYILSGLKSGVTAGNKATAEGVNASPSGEYAHSEGSGTIASGSVCHSEGYLSTASGSVSHAEGSGTRALGNISHAEGNETVASGHCSHAEGRGTIATTQYCHAQGRYNIEDTGNRYIHIVGIGSSPENRLNAHTIDISGNAWYLGKITQDGTPTAGNDVTTKTYVDASVESVNDNVTALQSSKENVSNKVTSLIEESTDEQYPSAKAVYAKISSLTAADIAWDDDRTLNGCIDLLASDIDTQFSEVGDALSARQMKTLYFSDITVSDWDADETYADYSYRASVALTDVEATMLPDIVYDVAEATSGNYAPVCAAYSGGVYIYSKVDDEITIPSIKCEVTS